MSLRIARVFFSLVFIIVLLPARTVRADSPFDGALDEVVAARRLPGVVLAVSAPRQEPWVGARGVANRATGEAMTPDHAFRVASISKVFVGTVALQLVEEGWLTLDQNVEQWLPGLVPRGERVMVRALLNHTSGLPDYLTEGFMRVVLRERGRTWTPQELVAAGLRRGVQPPGRWVYSNTNYVVLGLLIERVTGNSLRAEIHQRIIAPLSLTHTRVEPGDAVTDPLMHAYAGRRDLADGLTMSFAYSAGDITSTAADLARFVRALFDGTLLRPHALALMHEWTSTGGAWGTPSLVYGLGLMQRTLGVEATLVRGHTGALAGYRTALWYAPERDTVIVAVINEMNADPNAVIVQALRAITTPSPRTAAARPIGPTH